MLLITLFNKFTPIREGFGHWTVDKQTDVKMIVSQTEIKVE
jgi:hypothetical protein